MLERSTTSFLVALSAIAPQQSCATIATKQAVHILLDYVATYPSDGIIYQASDMVLCAHSNAEFLNETNSLSHTRAHIFLSKNEPFLHFNGTVCWVRCRHCRQIIQEMNNSLAEQIIQDMNNLLAESS